MYVNGVTVTWRLQTAGKAQKGSRRPPGHRTGARRRVNDRSTASLSQAAGTARRSVGSRAKRKEARPKSRNATAKARISTPVSAMLLMFSY